MRVHPMVLSAFFSLAVCQSNPALAANAPPAAKARAVSVDNDLYTLEYSWPAQAEAIPALRAMLEKDLKEQRAGLVKEAAEGRKDAQENGYPYNPHGLWVAWEVVRDLPGWLSLSAAISTYSGGAHPNHTFDAMLWDKRAGVNREVVDLFTSKEALSAVLREDFCKAIDRQREEKRGEPVTRDGDFFTDCLDPVDYPLILGSSNRKTFNRIGVLVPPYAAGPYVEGAYEVTLSLTPALLAAVKPQYRRNFSAGSGVSR